MRMTILTLAAACTLLPLAAQTAPRLPEAGWDQTDPKYQAGPWLDLSQKWCGRPAKTPAEKVERSRNILAMYLQAYRDVSKTGKLANDWFHNKCFAQNATVLGGTFSPNGTPRPMKMKPDADINDGTVAQQEISAYLKVVPNYTTIPGSVWIEPSENSAYYHTNFGGTATNGKFYDVWEVGVIKVNDAGYITHWEFWNDTQHIDDLMKETFHSSLKDAQSQAEGYLDAIKKSAGEKKQ